MAALVGLLLLLAPAAYAAVWAWLRGGLFATTRGTTATLPMAAAGLSDSPAASLAATVGASDAATSWPVAVPDLLGEAASEVWPAAGEAGGEASAAVPVPPDGPLLFSVLIAARDEAAALPALLAALGAQALSPACFEVLVADDYSADNTAALVLAAAATVPFALRLVSLPAGGTGKKAALAAAEAQARASWVVCTDADCRPGPGWLLAYAGRLAAPGPATAALHFLSGPVRLTPSGAWFDGLLGLEFAGLVGVGGACIGRGRPTMCNGANLAFRRSTFHEVGGYAGHAALASGDDEFLLHEIHRRYPAGVAFVAEARAVVDTPAPTTLAALLRQRVRWASKYPHYRPAAPRQLALLVLATNLSLALAAGGALAWPALAPWAAAAWALKLGADVWLLLPMLRLLHRRHWLGWLLPLQVVYAPYALAVGLAGRRGGGYRWKGRQVR